MPGPLFDLEFLPSPFALGRQCSAISFSVSKLKKEHHRQRSQKHTEKYRVCVPRERLLSGDCYSLKRTRLKGLSAPRTHCRIAKAKVIATRTSYETHIYFLRWRRKTNAPQSPSVVMKLSRDFGSPPCFLTTSMSQNEPFKLHCLCAISHTKYTVPSIVLFGRQKDSEELVWDV